MLKLCFLVVSCALTDATKLQNADEISDKTNPTREYENILTPGGYHFHYKTHDSERREDGVLDKTKGERGIIVVKGVYSFLRSDGKIYKVEYEADENGYRPLVTLETEESSTERPEQAGEAPTELSVIPIIGSAAIGTLVGGGLG